MAKQIWKFRLFSVECQDVSMPAGAEVLSVQYRGYDLFVWARVDPLAMPAWRRFFIYGTGHPIPDRNMRFLATVQEDGGSLIWHVFEEVLG